MISFKLALKLKDIWTILKGDRTCIVWQSFKMEVKATLSISSKCGRIFAVETIGIGYS